MFRQTSTNAQALSKVSNFIPRVPYEAQLNGQREDRESWFQRNQLNRHRRAEKESFVQETMRDRQNGGTEHI
jgi:hypothetical protein